MHKENTYKNFRCLVNFNMKLHDLKNCHFKKKMMSVDFKTLIKFRRG